VDFTAAAEDNSFLLAGDATACRKKPLFVLSVFFTEVSCTQPESFPQFTNVRGTPFRIVVGTLAMRSDKMVWRIAPTLLAIRLVAVRFLSPTNLSSVSPFRFGKRARPCSRQGQTVTRWSEQRSSAW
jgi:hypothetical protein